MEDDEKLKEERDFAVKTREKTSKGAAGELFATKRHYNNHFQLNLLKFFVNTTLTCLPHTYSILPASSTDAVKDPNYKPVYVAGAAGLPSLTNIPSVADLTASFAARKEERIKQEAEKKEVQRRVGWW